MSNPDQVIPERPSEDQLKLYHKDDLKLTKRTRFMGSKEDTFTGQRSLVRGKGVKMLNTVDLSVLCELYQYSNSGAMNL